ncbi:MAG: redoxin domain-containing protein [Actinomycetia bacterium]|nr:redoxin domain-containing protein [Actinomycetes bacterium]
MAQLRQDYEKFQESGTMIVVVGPEDAEAFASYWQNNDLPFVGLPDPKHSVLKLYGQEIKLFKLGRMPAQVLVDKSGIARFVHYGHDMSDIPPDGEILDLIASLEQ